MPRKRYIVPDDQRLITTFFKPAPAGGSHSERAINADSKKEEPPSVVKRVAAKARKRRKYAPEFLKERGELSSYDGSKTWGNYFLSATNNYSMFTVKLIDSAVDKETGKTLKPGSQIALAEVDEESNLTLISVNAGFQKQGIGTALIRFMNQRLPQFHVQETIDNSISAEGAALLESCVRKKILTDEQVNIGRCYPPSPKRSRS